MAGSSPPSLGPPGFASSGTISDPEGGTQGNSRGDSRPERLRSDADETLLKHYWENAVNCLPADPQSSCCLVNGRQKVCGSGALAMLQKKNGFTLIELLVVIAIISILAAFLFPVF